jgi:Raf kinase inhibitor-like YbhB/YbcL family protein
MKIISPAFSQNGTIPAKYTCDGTNVSPPLHISEVPTGTGSMAMIVEDPDAPGGTFIHWVVYNIPATINAVHENTEPGIVGRNNYNKTVYMGPCPPSGTHRYFFRLYALDAELDLTPGRSKQELQKAMKGHIVAEAELMGRYSRE